MAKNKLTDLNDHLFEQLERLNDVELTGDALVEEINRAKAVADISAQIISNSGLLLKAKVAADNFLNDKTTLPKMMED